MVSQNEGISRKVREMRQGDEEEIKALLNIPRVYELGRKCSKRRRGTLLNLQSDAILYLE